MAINKATLAKEVDGIIEYIYPKTSGDIVVYDDTHSVNDMIKSLVNGKVDKIEGKGLSTNDFTNEDKKKLNDVNLDVDSAMSSTSKNPVQNRVVEQAKENTHSYVDYTLKADSWVGNVYTIEQDYPAGTYIVFVSVGSCDAEQFRALNSARLAGTKVDANANVLIATGRVPQVDIPVVLELVKKKVAN